MSEKSVLEIEPDVEATTEVRAEEVSVKEARSVGRVGRLTLNTSVLRYLTTPLMDKDKDKDQDKDKDKDKDRTGTGLNCTDCCGTGTCAKQK
jgi:hypothetical protein